MCAMNVVVVRCECVVSCLQSSRLVSGLGLAWLVRAWGSLLLGNLPLLLFPCLARLVSAPGCGVPSAAYVGFSFPCLAWLLVAPGRPLAFPRLVCFFPFVSSNYTIVLRFFALLFWFFVLSKGYQLLVRRAWAHAHLVRLKSSCPRLCCNVIT